MKLCYRILIAGFLVSSFFISHSQSNIVPTVKPDATINYKKLSNIDTLINGYISRNWVNGVVTIIIKDGKVIQNKGYGYSDVATKTEMQPNSIFRIASQSKAIISAGVLLLYDEGKLSLSDPVSKYLPGFANPKVLDQFNSNDTSYTTVPAKRNITIEDLLTHTSGIDYAEIGTQEMKAIYAKARGSSLSNLAIKCDGNLQVVNGVLTSLKGNYLANIADQGGSAFPVIQGYVKYVTLSGYKVLVLHDSPPHNISDDSGLYWNDAVTASVQYEPCGNYDVSSGDYDVGTQHIFTVAAHTFSSSVSKAEANAAAYNLAYATAQNEADTAGYCYYP